MNDKAMSATHIFESLCSLAERIRSRSRFALRSDHAFEALLPAVGPFDSRPGRLYSFVGHKVRR
jgi:hypothetical protein